jgi:hypothetical protein
VQQQQQESGIKEEEEPLKKEVGGRGHISSLTLSALKIKLSRKLWALSFSSCFCPKKLIIDFVFSKYRAVVLLVGRAGIDEK